MCSAVEEQKASAYSRRNESINMTPLNGRLRQINITSDALLPLWAINNELLTASVGIRSLISPVSATGPRRLSQHPLHKVERELTTYSL